MTGPFMNLPTTTHATGSAGRMLRNPIFRNVARVGALGIVGRLFMVARDLVIAHHFGLGDALDAFMVASMVSLFLSSVLAASVGNAFLPLYVRARDNQNPAAARRLLALTSGFTLALTLGLSLLLAIGASPLLTVLAPGFDEPKRHLTVSLFRVLLPGLVLSGASLAFAPALNATGRLMIAAFGPVANAMVTLAVIVAGSRGPGIGVLAWATLAGTTTEALVLGWACRRQGLPVLPRFAFADPALRAVFAQAVPLAGAAILSTSNVLIDQAMAATLGSGSVACLGYGRKLVQLIVPLATVALSSVYLPRLAQLAAAGDRAALRSMARESVRAIMAVTIPLTLGLVFLSRPIVHLLFERGSFTSADTDAVTAVQQLGLLQIPFHIAGIVGVRLLGALGRNHLIAIVAAINLATNVTGNFVLMHLYGVRGIGLSTSIVFLISFALVQLAVWRELAVSPRGGHP